MIFKAIILTCFSNLEGERTASNIYHLLKGKKSIQTLQDAHLYQLERFYGIYSNLTKQGFNRRISKLEDSGYLLSDENQEGIYRLAESAVSWLTEHEQQLKIEYFHGLQYNEIAAVFHLRMLLLIQSLTNVRMKHYHFIPVTDNHSAEQWVKQSYRKMRTKEAAILQQLHKEIYSILLQLPDEDASVFVDRMTGYRKYGLSIGQLSEKYCMEVDHVHLLLTGIVHKMIATVIEDKKAFPLLAYILKDLMGSGQITHSAHKTYQLLSNNYTIDQIAAMRNLKTNTIHDHIVEVALYESDFPVLKYVTAEETDEILSAVNQYKSFRLKDIKHAVSDHISYFQIRLVLAVNKEKQGD
ncbi:helix-turn-helix domain-containing protein [Oceanobacillus massiliensis]|uniref:helix-turn-helix domain-containing protein n=1 Tax=Oceanobacillus massiliensis TaxID=1465765 RepID=UPI000288C1D6|nr:helix-turn-helix domain-containing protein [Oceanobacillus massiliensis]